MGFSPRGTCVSSWYGRTDWPWHPFHGHPGSAEDCSYSRIHPLLAITALRGFRRLSELACRRSAYPDASGAKQGSARCRNINLLPFRVPRLREHLGPTNPRLTNIAEEPWPFRRSGFSPLFAATPPRIHVRTRSTGPHGPTSTRARRPSTRSPSRCSAVSVVDLAPSLFGAHDLGW